MFSAYVTPDPNPNYERMESPKTVFVSRPVKVKRAPETPPARDLKQRGGRPKVAPKSSSPSRAAPEAVRHPSSPSKQEPSRGTLQVRTGQAYPKASPRRTNPTIKSKVGDRPRPATPSPRPSFPERPAGWGPIEETPQPSEKPGEGGTASKVTRRARPTFQPEFNLSERFPQLQSVSVKAEFKIEKDGSYEPTLLTSTGNPTADVVILGKLLEFEWLPALNKGEPIEDVRVLDISLDD